LHLVFLVKLLQIYLVYHNKRYSISKSNPKIDSSVSYKLVSDSRKFQTISWK